MGFAHWEDSIHAKGRKEERGRRRNASNSGGKIGTVHQAKGRTALTSQSGKQDCPRKVVLGGKRAEVQGKPKKKKRSGPHAGS